MECDNPVKKLTSNKKTNKHTTVSQLPFGWFLQPPRPFASGQSLFNTLMQAPRSVNFHTMDFIWVFFPRIQTEEIVGWFLSVISYKGVFLWNLFKKELCKHQKKTWRTLFLWQMSSKSEPPIYRYHWCFFSHVLGRYGKLMRLCHMEFSWGTTTSDDADHLMAHRMHVWYITGMSIVLSNWVITPI